MVNHSFEFSASASAVSADNATCKDIDIFNKDKITPTNIW
jgi:hypothetical protein